MSKTKRVKTGGRVAGVPNKTSQQMREFIQSFLSMQFDKLNEVFEELDPKDKINAVIKMLPYLLPKQAQMDVTATHKTEVMQDLSRLSDDELHALLEINKKLK